MIGLIAIASALAAAYLSFRYSALTALLNVYIPVFVFWPMSNYARFHGVALTPQLLASLPILVAMIARSQIRWRWRWTDLMVGLYILGFSYSDYRSMGDSSLAGADFLTLLLQVVPLYLFGRYLIEAQNARVAVLKRLVMAFFAVSILNVYEYRMAQNPFESWATRINSEPHYFLQQVRWGFGRTAGPFGHAINAGMLLSAALLFQYWLARGGYWEKKFKALPWLPLSKTTILLLGLLAGVWMTQSRGPWMGGIIGLVFLFAAKARKLKRGLIYAVILVAGVGGLFYVVTSHYTQVSAGESISSDQQNAVYRRQLIDNYIPVVQQGGLWGYGRKMPVIAGQDSIDNFYLFTALTNGYFGAGLCILMILNTLRTLLVSALHFKDRENATFAICLLAVMLSMAVTLTTVYMGFQSAPFFFLIVGWAQALSTRKEVLAPAASPIEARAERFAYRRVFN